MDGTEAKRLKSLKEENTKQKSPTAGSRTGPVGGNLGIVRLPIGHVEIVDRPARMNLIHPVQIDIQSDRPTRKRAHNPS